MGFGFAILFILVLVVLNGVFALSELALVSVRRSRLSVLEAQGVAGAARARELSEFPDLFLPTVQVGITLVSMLEGVFGGARLTAYVSAWLERFPPVAPYAEPLALALVVLFTTFLTLVLGELVPKQLALRNPERLAAFVAGPLTVLSRVAAPVVWVLGKSSSLVLRLFGPARPERNAVTEEEVRAVLAEGTEAGALESEERVMIERLLRLADKPVRAIMTPRTELAWIDRTDTSAEIAATLRASAHSRYVVGEGAVDNVVGVVLAKDLLDRMLADGALSVGDVLRQPMVMPDTVSALEALERLKADPLGMGLVLDEYGSFEGVVTAADVLEAIVGEAAGDGVQGGSVAQEGHMTLDGAMPVDEAKSRLNLPALPSEGDYHTLAGLLLALLRQVPREGDAVTFAGWRFTVAGMDGRRVARVDVTREDMAREDVAAEAATP